MNAPELAFDLTPINLDIGSILPVRPLNMLDRPVLRYPTILASIREVGIIEPLMVYPQKKTPGMYLLMDGHLRYYALRELGTTEAPCLISTEDECFTYNARVSRIAPIQEHSMIVKAVRNGVPVERVATALNLKVDDIRERMNLLNGISPEAVDLLKDKPITAKSLAILRRVTSLRQIEMAEMMIHMNNFSKAYLDALLMATPKDQLLHPEKPRIKTLTTDQVQRMEQELATLEQDFKGIEETYSENMLSLTVLAGYVKKLLDNAKVVRFLSARHPDMFVEFEKIVGMEAL